MNNLYQMLNQVKNSKQTSNNNPSSGHVEQRNLGSLNSFQAASGRRPIIKPTIIHNRHAAELFSSNNISNYEQSEKESPIYKGAIDENECPLDLSLNRDNILKGIIFSELLGKPKSKKKGL